MPFLQRIVIVVAATMAVVGSAGAAMAHGSSGNTFNTFVPGSHSFSGSWPVTVTLSQHSNWTGCLTLTENGRSASLVIGSQKFTSGSFLVINHTLVATITAQGYGQNAGLMFIAPASRGEIGPGVFEEVYGGSDFDSGALAFGMKGGC